jgi:hypothetical protein
MDIKIANAVFVIIVCLEPQLHPISRFHSHIIAAGRVNSGNVVVMTGAVQKRQQVVLVKIRSHIRKSKIYKFSIHIHHLTVHTTGTIQFGDEVLVRMANLMYISLNYAIIRAGRSL